MKQTAVEQLVKELSDVLGPINTDLVDVIDRAKDMEKDQLEDAWGARTWYRGEFKNYYNETFNTNEK